MGRIVATALGFLLFVGAATAADAPKAGVITGVTGEATIAHVDAAQPVPVSLRGDVLFQDRIDTQEKSGVRILLGGKAVMTVRELSSVTIEEQPRRAVAEVQWGQLVLRVLRDLTATGEVVEVHTPNAISAVRGSLLITEIGGTADNPETTFKALEVHTPILVSSRADPTRTTPLAVGQAVSVRGKGQAASLSRVRQMPPAELQRERRVAERLYHPLHRRLRGGAAQEARSRKRAAPNEPPQHPRR